VGNALIGAAVLTLKRRTTFDAAGQSDRLVTGGIFAFIQHPVVSGMGLIYLGFFLALPSPLVLGGLICYGCHQKRRVAAEEGLLEKRFGRRYGQYRCRVGRFWPKGPGRWRRG
jgi:protein-S-isoprenylcysteine O-methyltransferase Ste14